jgi:hypothetical protein
MKKWFLFFLSAFCFPYGAFSQALNDAGLWATINVEKKVSKRLEFFVRRVSISKYCFGVINLYNTLKHNNFNKNLLLLKKALHVTVTNA